MTCPKFVFRSSRNPSNDCNSSGEELLERLDAGVDSRQEPAPSFGPLHQGGDDLRHLATEPEILGILGGTQRTGGLVQRLERVAIDSAFATSDSLSFGSASL